MASAFDIIGRAMRELKIHVCGVEIVLTERLMKDPAFKMETQERAAEVIAKMRGIADQARVVLPVAVPKKGAKKPVVPDEEVAREEVAQMVAQMDRATEAYRLQEITDDRQISIKAILSRVATWDLTDGLKKVIPLEYEALLKGQFDKGDGTRMALPTELFSSILEEMDKVPIVPEAKGSPSKKPSTGA